MEVKKEQRGIYPLAIVFVMLMLLDAYCCGAVVLVKSNTTVRCNGRLDECLIEDDLELESLTHPYFSRMLQGPSSHPGVNAVNNAIAQLVRIQTAPKAARNAIPSTAVASNNLDGNVFPFSCT